MASNPAGAPDSIIGEMDLRGTAVGLTSRASETPGREVWASEQGGLTW